MVAAFTSAALLIAPLSNGQAQQREQPTDSRAAAEIGNAGVRNDLLTLYREALANDAVLASARALQLATQEQVPQARAALLPSLGASARYDYNLYRSSNSDTGSIGSSISSNYSVYGGGLDLVVPVYRPQNWTALDQAKLTVLQSEAQLAQSTQDLALRVANAYFNVLAARDQLIALLASKQATSEQLQQARREFEVGTKTIIDTNEGAGAVRSDRSAGAGRARHLAGSPQRAAGDHCARTRYVGTTARAAESEPSDAAGDQRLGACCGSR